VDIIIWFSNNFFSTKLCKFQRAPEMKKFHAEIGHFIPNRKVGSQILDANQL
jgi:hypothetical protein